MDSSETDPKVAEIVEAYLRAQDSCTMSCLVNENAPVPYSLLARYQDCLGWNIFIEDRFLSILVQIQCDNPSDSESWRIAESWGTGLMEQLLRLMYRQWLHRNAIVHFFWSDGRTILQGSD